MEALLQANSSSGRNSSTTCSSSDPSWNIIMASILSVLCIILLLVAVQAEAWLSSVRYVARSFQQRIHYKTTNKSNQGANNNSNNNNNEVDDSHSADTDAPAAAAAEKTVMEESEEAERKRLSRLPWWEDSWSEAFLNSFPLSSLSTTNATRTTTTTSNTAKTPTIMMAHTDDNELSHYTKYQPNQSAKVLHFCFLLHGHRGFSTDLSYLQRAMQHYGEQEKRTRYQHDDDKDNKAAIQHDMIVHCPVCNEGKTMDGVVSGGERMVQEILQVIRQELDRRKQERSSDGAPSGDTDDEDGIHDITVSIVGNSLGGIYGRYAIAKLADQAAAGQDHHSHPDSVRSINGNANSNSNPAPDQNDDDGNEFPSCVLLDGKYRLHFNIFLTTATPHLGISKHTYVPLPRSVEIGAAHALGNTGKDLFRLNDLMKEMATCPKFLDPLRKFRKRVAYANAYGTDFPVPASTAAFLSEQSTYPHHFSDIAPTKKKLHDGTYGDRASKDNNTTSNNDSPVGDDVGDGFVIATLHTPPSKSPSSQLPYTEEEAIVDDLVQMSYSLDSLGWKKVFIDVRKEIPLRVSLPKSFKGLTSSLLLSPSRLLRRESDQSNHSSGTDDETTAGVATSDDDDDESSGVSSSSSSSPLVSPQLADAASPTTTNESVEAEAPPLSAMHQLRQRGIVESRDVASMMSTPEDMRLHFPLGHNLMVALSREGFSGRMYKGGRPVMDVLAKELVHDIFDWNIQEENNAAEKTLMMSTADSTC